MIQDGNLPRDSKILINKTKEGYDYIKTPSNEIIFFTHKFDNKVFDKILEGNYRISQATYNPKRKVVEIKVNKKWQKLEPELSEPEAAPLFKYKNLKYLYSIFFIFTLIFMVIGIILNKKLLGLAYSSLIYMLIFFILSRMPPERAEKVVLEFFDVYIITKYKLVAGILNYSFYIITILLTLSGILIPLVAAYFIIIFPILEIIFILVYYGFVKKEF